MKTGINDDLLLDFFLTFSRFEFALKQAGFFVRNIKSTVPYEAKPDWKGFAKSLCTSFDSDASPELKQATDDIFLNPPFREVVSGDTLGWDTKGPEDSFSPIEKLLAYVRMIRNNLFHGGKFESKANYNREWNTSLLNASLVILRECLTLSPDVKRHYDDATL